MGSVVQIKIHYFSSTFKRDLDVREELKLFCFSTKHLM